MWEDCKTGLKWVKVTNCYFPDDLPGNIGHPCISEVNEVYESNGDRTEMANSIRGPCEVLPSDKFKQENDMRCQLGIEETSKTITNKDFHVYDEANSLHSHANPCNQPSDQPQIRHSGWDSTFWKPKTEMKLQRKNSRLNSCNLVVTALTPKMPCKDVAVGPSGCSEVLWCHINYLGNRWNVGKKEEQPALLWQSPGEKVISGVGGWAREEDVF
ncbi:hypothetical protein JHK85_039313 [Glycine max]|nr:hypothetical protein JHK85_039313 [Glycine max]